MVIISRAQWGARPPRSTETVPWPKRQRVDVHYSAGPATQTPRVIQDFHMDTRKWADIGYNFLVNTKGEIFEGRGWTNLGAHIAGHNTAGIGVCFIGRDADVTEAAKKAIRWLADEADRLAGRHLTRDGHRDLASTECPGNTLHRWVHAGLPVDGQALPEPSTATRGVSDLFCKKGDKGVNVEWLQWMLRSAGYDPGDVDSDYGPKTAAALLALRRSVGTTATSGDTLSPAALEHLFRVHAQRQASRGPKGDPGPKGDKGAPGDVTATVAQVVDELIRRLAGVTS
ncbi:peptidoglycan recognition protein family protein [Rhizomonospora bruguierae]|uniref:peptidoglycan recognition protein family protein n=1 Tax=Rhizomonospora bruguierae TaxID=1581705 RepID=UPI0020BD493E|nr:peptidoglycan-binding domain-containing protein [Micromonospora sp. NBRC 107566]